MNQRQQMPDIDVDPKVVSYGIIIVLVLFLAYKSIAIIDPTEQGVVLRLGRALPSALQPGPHFVIPIVDRVYRVETEIIHKEEFGYRSTGSRGGRTEYRGVDEEALIVTGDLNIAEVEWSVQYKIGDPYKYLFKVNKPVDTLRDLSESVMGQTIGNRNVYEVLTVGREQIEVQAKIDLQKALDQYETGIKVTALKLQNVLPPDKVKPSYNEVNEAEQYREQLINQAQEKYNAAIPRAEGVALQRLEQAKGYQVDRINRAKGEADRFVAIYEAYRQAKDVTKRRMYLETMASILGSMDQVVLVDEDLKSFLPLMNLNQEGKNANQ